MKKLLIIILLSGLVIGCHKDQPAPPTSSSPPSTTKSETFVVSGYYTDLIGAFEMNNNQNTYQTFDNGQSGQPPSVTYTGDFTIGDTVTIWGNVSGLINGHSSTWTITAFGNTYSFGSSAASVSFTVK